MSTQQVMDMFDLTWPPDEADAPVRARAATQADIDAFLR